MKPRVLIVDDEANIRRMLAALLKAEGFEPEEAPHGNAALLSLDQLHPDAILLDLQMPPGPDGLETLRQIRERDPSTLVVMMSGKAQLNDAVQAIKLGAFQFLEKPLTPEAVLVALRSGLELTRARAENRALRSQLVPRADLVGTSGRMDEVRALIAQVAPTEARVLIFGESGTGKELVAHAIHRASHRAARPIVSVNCAAIPRDLVESEMFGHERGAFTGAVDRRLGRFELADSGTLFLDEVGDLNLEAQAKLLRVLETGEIQRLGAERVQRADVRVIAATNQRLEQAVAAGSFREDLYFRLNVFPVQLAPLRDRLEDLPALVMHLAERVRPHQPAAFTADAIALLGSYEWPGNVRELANVVERLSILGGAEVDAALVRQVLPRSGSLRFEAPTVTTDSGTTHSIADLGGRSLSNVLDDYERALIGAALKRASGNVAEAARALQTDRANLYRRMKRLGL
ncbi:MAG TPA: sigma-54 dependent transcriptional regulator [Gemmatimonadales bacterium]|jgi:two-component system nitrogen regulation response regulator NtrX|nr:sigma-54 dependent transcriptional regulator [Gemmatimonadales bacterium]